LSHDLVAGQPPADAYAETHKIEGASITLGVRRNT
jgi:hypothetical protein